MVILIITKYFECLLSDTVLRCVTCMISFNPVNTVKGAIIFHILWMRKFRFRENFAQCYTSFQACLPSTLMTLIYYSELL